MRIGYATLAAIAVVAAGLAAVPAQAAAPAPVSSISVAPSIDNQGISNVNVSWAGADPSADGVVVCLQRGTSAPATPDNCESRVVVAPPSTSSGPISLHNAKTYTIAVYDYIGTTPDPTYSTPVAQLRHGTSLTLRPACKTQSPGSRCIISGVLKDVYRGVALAQRHVELWSARTQTSTWTRLARVTTDSTGRAQTTITLDKSRLYQWRYPSVRVHELPTSTSQYAILVSS
jgi:hypothetical protein